MQDHSHIAYQFQAPGRSCRDATHANGCLGAPLTLESRGLPHQMNRGDLRYIAQLAEVQSDTPTQHLAEWEDVVG